MARFKIIDELITSSEKIIVLTQDLLAKRTTKIKPKEIYHDLYGVHCTSVKAVLGLDYKVEKCFKITLTLFVFYSKALIFTPKLCQDKNSRFRHILAGFQSNLGQGHMEHRR